jgi:hypothetical protein
MERNDYNGGFEHFLKDKADQYKLYPSDRVWNAINDRLHPKSKWPYLVVAAIFLGLGIGGKIFDSSLSGSTVNKDTRALTVLTDNSPELQSFPDNSASTRSLTSNSGKNSMKLVHSNPDLVTNYGRSAQNKQQETSLKVVPGGKLTVKNQPVSNIEAIAGTQSAKSADAQIQNGYQIETGSLLINDQPHDLATVSIIQNKAAGKPVTETKKAPKTTAIKVLKPYKDKFGLQFYMSPTVSYRKLYGDGIKTYGNSLGSTFNYSNDVNSAVTHKPMIGTEVGAALVFNMNKKLRFKTGIQVNFNQYESLGFENSAELVPMTAAGIGHTQVNAMSTFRSSGTTQGTWLRNQHIMIAIPVGAELSVYNSRNVQLNIAGSLQPTYSINNRSYMVSSDLKNYAQAPSLYRHFNMNTSIEAFLSIKSGSVKWSIGPQLRYQILSSFKKEYPISEHLLDYGFKIGLTKTLK